MPRPLPEIPGPGQESVWDYPRPPRIESVTGRVTIQLGGQVIVDTRDVVRVLETSHPPVYYLPIADFASGALADGEGSSFCEFKGAARYLDVRGGGEVRPASAWNYPHPSPGFEVLRDRVAVYAQQMDETRLTARSSRRSPEVSTAAGSRAPWSGPSRGRPGHSAGELSCGAAGATR